MSHRSPENWSLFRSLAFLAATFAIAFGALAPAAVAASPAGGAPIMLCSGDQVFVVYGDDGHPEPVQDTDLASLSCASALLSALDAVPAPPPAAPDIVAPRPIPAQPDRVRTHSTLRRLAPRPPSTAPPLS